MAEYIEREALYEKAYWHGKTPDVGNPYADGVEAVDVKDIDAIPSADVAPVVHGEWIGVRNGKGICSRCNRLDSIDPLATHCRYCGAKMRERKCDDG